MVTFLRLYMCLMLLAMLPIMVPLAILGSALARERPMFGFTIVACYAAVICFAHACHAVGRVL